MYFTNKSVVVTGASSGIGRGIAYEFAKNGAVVIAVARRAERLEELQKECEEFEGRIVPFVADVTEQENIKAMLEKAIEETGSLDVLINNAGAMDYFTPIGDMDDELWHWIMNLNLNAPVFAMREAVNIMKEQENGGNIININSLAGLSGAKAGAAYTASKHALTGVTKNTAHMYKHEGIRVNSVVPGGIESEVNDDPSKFHQFGIGRVMSAIETDGLMGMPYDIAQACLYLANNDLAKFVNGANLVVDGGVLASE